jgi:hypothetical protein
LRLLLTLLTCAFSYTVVAQLPPAPPPADFPKAMPMEGKKKAAKQEQHTELKPDREGVRPGHPEIEPPANLPQTVDSSSENK